MIFTCFIWKIVSESFEAKDLLNDFIIIHEVNLQALKDYKEKIREHYKEDTRFRKVEEKIKEYLEFNDKNFQVLTITSEMITNLELKTKIEEIINEIKKAANQQTDTSKCHQSVSMNKKESKSLHTKIKGLHDNLIRTLESEIDCINSFGPI
ncbi:putative SP-containing protein [Vairimorpha necatrix]|uniref:SP-containing protein n=1 Tax=Vairimorpha necatrix TaxID=6039 RepID=A0AAX4JB46_9MICR